MGYFEGEPAATPRASKCPLLVLVAISAREKEKVLGLLSSVEAEARERGKRRACSWSAPPLQALCVHPTVLKAIKSKGERERACLIEPLACSSN